MVLLVSYLKSNEKILVPIFLERKQDKIGSLLFVVVKLSGSTFRKGDPQ